MVVFEFNIRKKQGEDLTKDIIDIIKTKLNNDPAWIEVVENAVPVQGVNDDGKPYILLTTDSAAIVMIRKDKNNVLAAFIRPTRGIGEIDSILQSRYHIFAFRGRTSPYERQIRTHILEMIAEGQQEAEQPEEKEKAEQPEEKEKADKKERKEKKERESDEVTEEIIRGQEEIV